jgi:hypothetical protein
MLTFMIVNLIILCNRRKIRYLYRFSRAEFINELSNANVSPFQMSDESLNEHFYIAMQYNLHYYVALQYIP